MRSIKLTRALVASAMVLALAPAAALAAPGQLGQKHLGKHLGVGKCHLSEFAAPRFVQTGETALVFGQLVCGGAVSAGAQTVTVLEHAAGTIGLTTAGTATTDSLGRYQLTTPALLTNATFVGTALGAQSPRRAVKVSPKVTISGPPDGSQLFTGAGPFIHNGVKTGFKNRVTFSGSVTPADAGATVVLQRESAIGGEEWHRIDLGLVAPGGSYSITHTFVVPGEANIRVVVRPFKLNTRGASESLSYEISQAQNPALTILSSANPITYGGSTTISGVIASGSGVPMTLLARTHAHKGFSAVATTTSTTGGAYTFPVQMPLVNTLYRVTGGAKSSAGMFEGVRYGLIPAVPAASVAAGSPLTFSGTVTPVHAGHPVYLQAQNPSGIGFHIVQIGNVAADGTYSITHVPFNAGTRKFRIKVPGDPENQGVVGTPMAVTVTPAPLGLLRPERPGNSSLPVEGSVH